MLVRIAHTVHRARRDHKHTCFRCLLPIWSGDTYQRTAIADDGRVYSYCTHIQCVSAIVEETENYLYDDPDEGLPEGILVNGYLDEEDLTPEWRAWYAQRCRKGGDQ